LRVEGEASGRGWDIAGTGTGWDIAGTGTGWDIAGTGTGSGEVAVSSIWQSTVLTGTTSFSFTSLRMTRPFAGAGTSASALSVDTVKSGWSFLTRSPSFTSHFETVPSETLSPS